MLKKVLLVSILFLILMALSIVGINYLNIILFRTSPWILAISLSLGLLIGGLRARFKNTFGSEAPAGLIKRHTVASYFEHWGTAFGLFVLMISGLLLFGTPDLFQMNLHFGGLFITLLFGGYFLADFFVSKKFNNLLPSFMDITDGTIKKYIFRIKWIDNGKYLASQKSSFLASATFGIGIVITGLIKLAGILWSLPAEIIHMSTSVHDIAAVIFVMLVFVHMILVLSVRSNRRLLRSWFTGTIPEEGQKTKTTTEDEPDPNSL
jgi:cytochrome b subunit of formate dehydrogenase